jgi:hypothetical protein
MAGKVSPMQRSLALLRAEGFYVEITERWNPFSKRKNDLMGFIDILAVHRVTGDVRAVQTTSASNVSSRINKIIEHENLSLVRKAGWTIHVHGWAKRKAGWVCRVEDVS